MAVEYPAQGYYPGCKVRLILRFEEFKSSSVKDAVNVGGKAPDAVSITHKGLKAAAALTVSSDPDVAGRLVVGEVATQPGASAGPQGQANSKDQLTHAIEGIIPFSATWNQNGIRTADTASVVLKFPDCPFDPRVIRSAGLELYMGMVTGDEFAAGTSGGRRTGSGDPLRLIPDTYMDVNGRQRTNLRFQGFVDKWEVDWGNDSLPMVHLECRDNTQLFIDTEAPPKLVIAAAKPIDRAIAEYLANFPTFRGMGVEYRPAGANIPVLATALHATAFPPKLGPAPAKGGAGTQKLSVWDYITDVCGAIGHTVRVDGTTIILQQLKTLLSNTGATRPDDPFVGRADWKARRFIYGRNLISMKVDRTFSKTAPRNIEIRSYNPQRKNVLVVRFPEKADRVAQALPGDGAAEQKWTVYHVTGIKDKGALKVVAENVYQSIGRNELGMSLQTRNLASFGGGNQDPDVLDMKPGDTFELLTARDDVEDGSSAGKLEGDLLARAVKLMTGMGYSQELATAYGNAYANGNFQKAFRLKTMSVQWSIGDDGGLAFSLNGANYLEVRVDEAFRSSVEGSG